MFRGGERLAGDTPPGRQAVKVRSLLNGRKKMNSISCSENVSWDSVSTESLSSYRNKSSSRQLPHHPSSLVSSRLSPSTHEWKYTDRHRSADTKITLKARQKKIALELRKLSLRKEISAEEIEEKQLEEDTGSSSRLRDILKTKLGIGIAKNIHAATMNAVLLMRPKQAAPRDGQGQMAFSWMKTFINRIWVLYKFSQVMKQHSSSLLDRSARMEAEDVLRTVEQRSAHRDKSSSHSENERREDIPKLLARPKSLLPPRYRQILNKYPQGRTESDISNMRVFLRSSFPEFKQYSECTQLALCQSMYYTFYEKGRVILRQGNRGKNFYIALSGSLVSMQSDIDSNTGEVYTCDNIMKPGERFGDIALQRKTKRTATVVSCEESELLMIDKDLFDGFCPNLSDEQLKEKLKRVLEGQLNPLSQ